ncbi:MAG: 2-oxoglutarate dehydrogenase E1 component, partial [Calditrichaeota bacterium]
MEKLSYLSNAHPDYIESLYQEYLRDPESVDISWRRFFEGFELGRSADGKVARRVELDRIKEIKVLNLINAYRTRGHLFTKTNPVRERRKWTPTLDIENFGLTQEDLDTVFEAGREIWGLERPATLREIIEYLQQTYCRSIGVEYMFIRIPERVEWLQKRMESTRNMPQFSIEEKRHILRRLSEAVGFEKFLHSRYVGQKRFALSGHETLIPALDAVIEKGAALGVMEIVLGMAHRGRLNVLANVLRKSYRDIFAEFEGAEYEDAVFEGDVKYHLGFSSDVITSRGKRVHLNLVANPSHLEAVDPVVEG